MIEKKHYHGIDSIRFLAACWVFAMHAIYITNYYNGSDWYKFLQQTIIRTGVFGVYFFFVMSGFFILNLLFIEKSSTQSIDIKRFYSKRARRIVPVYIVVLFLGFVFVPLFNFLFPSTKPFIDAYLYIPFDRWYYYIFGLVDFDLSWHSYTIPVLSVLWSVCVEIKFYLLAPLLVKYLNKYVLLLFLLAVIAFSAWFRIEHFTQPSYYHYHPLAFSDMLAIGALLAWTVHFVPSFVQKIKLIPAWLTLMPYLLTLCIVLSRKWIYSHGEWAEWIVSVEPIFVSLLFAGIIAEQNFAEKSVLKFGNWDWIRYLGVRTYGVYGFHLFFLFLVIAIFQIAGWHKLQSLNNWVYLAEIMITFILTLLASIWFYNKVELPIMKGTFWKRKS